MIRWGVGAFGKGETDDAGGALMSEMTVSRLTEGFQHVARYKVVVHWNSSFAASASPVFDPTLGDGRWWAGLRYEAADPFRHAYLPRT